MRRIDRIPKKATVTLGYRGDSHTGLQRGRTTEGTVTPDYGGDSHTGLRRGRADYRASRHRTEREREKDKYI